MKISALAYIFFLPLARPLTTPPVTGLIQPSLNETTALSTENSILGRPLGPGIRALEYDFNIVWHRGDSITTNESTHLFYNLFIALLRLWRTLDDRPFDRGLLGISTLRYREIETFIVQGATQPAKLTPNLAAALVWHMLPKCTVDDPSYWTASLVARGVSIVDIVGLVRSEARSGSPVASERDLVSSSAKSHNVSTISGQRTNLTSGNDVIDMFVDFQGSIPIANPRALGQGWLDAFLEWSSALLTPKQPNAVVPWDAQHHICRTTYAFYPSGLNIVLLASGVVRPDGTEPLTYDEFFRGIQQVLEIVVVTAQYKYISASIFKHGWLAATFTISPSPT